MKNKTTAPNFLLHVKLQAPLHDVHSQQVLSVYCSLPTIIALLNMDLHLIQANDNPTSIIVRTIIDQHRFLHITFAFIDNHISTFAFSFPSWRISFLNLSFEAFTSFRTNKTLASSISVFFALETTQTRQKLERGTNNFEFHFVYQVYLFNYISDLRRIDIASPLRGQLRFGAGQNIQSNLIGYHVSFILRLISTVTFHQPE